MDATPTPPCPRCGKPTRDIVDDFYRCGACGIGVGPMSSCAIDRLVFAVLGSALRPEDYIHIQETNAWVKEYLKK